MTKDRLVFLLFMLIHPLSSSHYTYYTKKVCTGGIRWNACRADRKLAFLCLTRESRICLRFFSTLTSTYLSVNLCEWSISLGSRALSSSSWLMRPCSMTMSYTERPVVKASLATFELFL